LKHATKDEKAWDKFLRQNALLFMVGYVGFYIVGFIIQIQALKVTIQKTRGGKWNWK